MILKGGTLLGIRYGSTRFTTDIDFSTEKKLDEIDVESFIETFNDSMDLVETGLNYGVKCLVQSYVIKPNPKGTFPTIKIKVGYCERSNARHLERLNERQSPLTIAIDYSFNEKAYTVEMLQLGDDPDKLLAYDICDLLAEKIRSILQQSVRKRYREQDVYDIHYLTSTISPLKDSELEVVLRTLISKSQGKGIDNLLNVDGIDDEDIVSRSAEGYPKLKDTVAELPEFDVAYSSVRELFKSLPWSILNEENASTQEASEEVT